MITEAFPHLEEARAIKALRRFLRSGWYVVCIVLLMACSELFALEIPVMYCYFVLGVAALLFAEDTLPLVPIVCCSYMLFSAGNNPGKHTGETLFSQPQAMVQLIFILALTAVLLIGRLVVSLQEQRRRGVPRLLIGFAALGLAYVLGGAFSPYYSGKTVLFGLLQIASLCAFYFYFYFTVQWERVPKGYVAMLFSIVGVGIAAQIGGMYFNEGAFTGDGVNRAALYTGWGIYNNVGCVMAMCMPAPVYFATTRRHGWAFTLLNCFFFLAVLLTQSRSSMLFGAVIFLACVVVTLVKSRGKERIWSLIVYAALVVAAAVGVAVLWEHVSALFRSVISAGLNDYARFDTWKACWKRFLEYPAFGVGFYKTPGTVLVEGGMNTSFEGYPDGAPEGWFMPPRSHNTLFQLLATGGVFAVVAYAVHRVETLVLFFRKPGMEKTVAFLCVAAMLLTSLLDCHVFNFGPGLLYSLLLVFSEGAERRDAAEAPSSAAQEMCTLAAE